MTQPQLSSGGLNASYTGTPGIVAGLDNTKSFGFANYKFSVTTAAWWAQGIADTPVIGIASTDIFTSTTPHLLSTGMMANVVALGDTAVYKAWQATTVPAFVDQTAAANNGTANDVTPFATGVSTNYFAVGYTNNFGGIKVVIGTAGTVGTLTWEYWNGTAWTALSGVVDNSTQFKAAAGTYTVTWTVPSDWATTSLNGETAAYYIRARCTGNYTVNPLLTQVWIDGVLPTGISAATPYFAIVLSPTTFKLATSKANAIAGTAIDVTTNSGGIVMSTVAVAAGAGSALLPAGVFIDIDGINGSNISVVQDTAGGKASVVPFQGK